MQNSDNKSSFDPMKFSKYTNKLNEIIDNQSKLSRLSAQSIPELNDIYTYLASLNINELINKNHKMTYYKARLKCLNLFELKNEKDISVKYNYLSEIKFILENFKDVLDLEFINRYIKFYSDKYKIEKNEDIFNIYTSLAKLSINITLKEKFYILAKKYSRDPNILMVEILHLRIDKVIASLENNDLAKNINNLKISFQIFPEILLKNPVIYNGLTEKLEALLDKFKDSPKAVSKEFNLLEYQSWTLYEELDARIEKIAPEYQNKKALIKEKLEKIKREKIDSLNKNLSNNNSQITIKPSPPIIHVQPTRPVATDNLHKLSEILEGEYNQTEKNLDSVEADIKDLTFMILIVKEALASKPLLEAEKELSIAKELHKKIIVNLENLEKKGIDYTQKEKLAKIKEINIQNNYSISDIRISLLDLKAKNILKSFEKKIPVKDEVTDVLLLYKEILEITSSISAEHGLDDKQREETSTRSNHAIKRIAEVEKKYQNILRPQKENNKDVSNHNTRQDNSKKGKKKNFKKRPNKRKLIQAHTPAVDFDIIKSPEQKYKDNLKNFEQRVTIRGEQLETPEVRVGQFWQDYIREIRNRVKEPYEITPKTKNIVFYKD